jgi:hypothetical protein
MQRWPRCMEYEIDEKKKKKTFEGNLNLFLNPTR